MTAEKSSMTTEREDEAKREPTAVVISKATTPPWSWTPSTEHDGGIFIGNDGSNAAWIPGYNDHPHNIANAELIVRAVNEMAARALPPQPTGDVEGLSDEDLVKLVHANFDERTKERLLRTVWKDSIDVEEPGFYLKRFAAAITAAANSRLAEAEQAVATQNGVITKTIEKQIVAEAHVAALEKALADARKSRMIGESP